jgi:hypothetical protein
MIPNLILSIISQTRKDVGMEQESLSEKLKQLEKDKEELLAELEKLKSKPEAKIGYILLFTGLILLIPAFIYSHNVSAFIGISLVFWGALLLYIRPTRFIRKEILDSIITESLDSYNKLIVELGYEGTPHYISPSTILGLQKVVLYIPRSNHTLKPTDEQLSADEALISNPQSIKLTPAGLGLSRLIENELKTNFSYVDLDYLQNNLEKVLVEGLEISEAFQMEPTEFTVHVEIKGSVFFEAIQEQSEYEKKMYIGDPLSSAIACILARSTRQHVVIENIQLEPKEKTIKIDFKLLEPSK